RGRRVFAQRIVVLRPEPVLDERPLVRMPEKGDAEEVANLALETRRRIRERRKGWKLRLIRIKRSGCVQKPVRGAVREDVVHEEDARGSASIVSAHENQVGAEPDARELIQRAD